MMTQFHRVSTLDALLGLYGEVNANSLRKEVPALTPEYRQWIEASPFFTIATSGPGGLDCSPRGDKAGQLFLVLDAHTLVIPDRRGNNRLDTLRNLISDPRVGLLFFIPGVAECVRVNGTAIVSTDPLLRARFAVDGALPVTVIVVSIASVYFQCARSIMRSGLWESAADEKRLDVPTAGEMTRSGDASFDAASYDAALKSRQTSTLY
jgi:hypothetical protein